MSTQAESPSSSSERPLPSGFETIQDILDISNEKLRRGHKTNVIGVVNDYQPPKSTRGTGSAIHCTAFDSADFFQITSAR
jgi:hypothetical protein